MKCLVTDCQKVVCSRGLCVTHLSRLKGRIAAGKTTYAKAEKAGQCLPAISRAEQNRRWGYGRFRRGIG